MRTLTWAVVAALLFSCGLAVDRNNFKTCDQSGFCKRLRGFKPESTQYELNLDTVIVQGNIMTAEVNRIDLQNEKKEVMWKYALRLSALVDGTYRIEMDEAKPLYPRYRPQLALEKEPKGDGLKIITSTDGKLTLTNNQQHKVLITSSPLIFTFLDQNGSPAVILNSKGLMHMEPYRTKEEKVDNGEGEGDIVDADGTWAENFKSHHDSKPRGNEAISMDISFPDADFLFGIPEHTDNFALRTTTSSEPYRLFNLDVFEYELDSTMAIYGAVPVLYAHSGARTVGVFWHNAAETWVDIENNSQGNVVSSIVNLVTGRGDDVPTKDARFMSESGVLDIFVMLGPKPHDVTRQYTTLTGVAPIPPKFSVAYHQCRWNYVDEADVRGVDENFDLHDIPVDVIWLDIEYTDRKKYFTWDLEKFGHPSEMVANLTAKGRNLVVIIDPHIKREAGYFLHETATDNGYYVKNHQGNDYEGWCWPGSSSYLDFLNPVVSAYYSGLYSYDNFPGTSRHVHIWNDMNEPSVFNGPEVTMPKDCRHYRPPQDGVDGVAAYWEHRHIHNEYGLWQVAATHHGMLQRDNNKYRPFILTRSTFAGTQRYAAVWTGDNMAEWSHLAVSVPMCLSLSAGGISFCGADVGGFFKYPEAELMTRWYQLGAFQPFFRAHSHIETKRREPWLYEPATTALIRDAVRRRYALLDHWYTMFYEHTRDGVPVMRALLMEYPNDKEAYNNIDTEYLLGSNLLIRPVTSAGATSVKVYLPGLDSNTLWYDVDSYHAHKPGYIDQEVNIAKIPVYQRGGSIIPRKERVRRSSIIMADDPYTLVVALSDNNTASGTLYIDDGETYEYKNNKYIYAKLEYQPEQLTYTFIDKSTYPTRSWLERVVIAGIKTPPKNAKLIQTDKQTSLQMTLHRGNDVLVIRKPGASMREEWKIVFSY